MLVVKRPFKNLGKVYTAGSVITEPATIKRLRGKIAEGKIIEVTEQTYDVASNYFKAKYGVILPSLTDEVVEAKPVEPAEQKSVEPAETKTTEPTEKKVTKTKATKASVVSTK